jgi:3-oxoacyl-[acyl-carrier protein] reductase
VSASVDVSLQNRVVLVTGAGQGLANAVAECFAAAGGRLALAYLPDDADAAAQLAERTHAELVCPCDPADPAAVRKMVRSVASELGSIDVLANASTHRAGGAAHEMSLDDWHRVLNVELSGTLYFCREVIRPMLRKRRGRIINFTDVAGLRGEIAHANHAAARGGIAALTRALASELAPLGIHVNAVAISYLADEVGALDEAARLRLMRNTPLARAGRADEAARAALFLASDACSFTTGHLLQVNGGLYL